MVSVVDLSTRTALSKSELTTAAMCQRRAYFMRTQPRPWVPIEKVTFGSAVDAGVMALVSQLRGHGKIIDPNVALSEAALVVTRDEIAVDFGEVEKALERFEPEIAPLFDWSFAATQHHIAIDLDGIGPVDSHPDICLFDGSVLDVKTAARAKTIEDVTLGIEMPWYALLREAETGITPPRVGYLTWVRTQKPYWQPLIADVTPEMLRRAAVMARAHASARELNDMAGENVALVGTPRSWSLCGDCLWNDTCELAPKDVAA